MNIVNKDPSMCIFSGEVQDVSKTRIAVFQVWESEKKKINGKMYKIKTGAPLQLTIYENAVSTEEGASMILPFPLIKGKNRFKLIDLSDYENIIEDLDDLFPAEPSANALEIKKVGSYKVSVVPNFASFGKLNYLKFNLSPGVEGLLRQYYSENFGFLVCKIKKTSKFHPIAYVHEAQTPFIPTRHYHIDAVSISSGSKFSKVPTPVDLNEVDNDTQSDIYAHQQIRRTGLTRKMASLNGPGGPLGIKDGKSKVSKASKNSKAKNSSDGDWDHKIYIFNFSVENLRSLVKMPGVSYSLAPLFNLENIKNRVKLSEFPDYIFFGDITSAVKINIGKLYTGNHDIFL